MGANDGMLHAFDASESTNAGNEVFAVVPYSTFEAPDGTPQSSGLQALARPTYTHHYYMNATPLEIRDVDCPPATASLPSAPARRRLAHAATGQGKGGQTSLPWM